MALASGLWSPMYHTTFPVAVRTHAFVLLQLGHQLAKAVRPGGQEAMAFVDVWVAHIVPIAIGCVPRCRSVAIRRIRRAEIDD